MENQVKINDELHDLGALYEKEKELILYIRNKFQFGEISIQIRDGQPYRIMKGIEYQALDC